MDKNTEIWKNSVAVILAAGSGKRMGSATAKQFLPLCGKPVLYWTLAAFEASVVEAAVLVVSDEEAGDFCRKEIIEKYGFAKVRAVALGGEQRYDSVFRGLEALKNMDGGQRPEYVAIHDGARCLVTPEIIGRTFADAKKHGAAVAAMPVKDTIKIVDEECFAKETPDRRTLYLMQTPQTFEFPLICKAYEDFIRAKEEENAGKYAAVTDDAEVLEWMAGRRSYMTEGSYENLKITTPEDMLLAEAILKGRGEGE